MAKTSLTDMQRIILSHAAMRMDCRILPVPKSLQKDQAAISLSIRPLLDRELVAEIPAEREDTVWRENAEGDRVALVITPAGMAAIGVAADEHGPDEPAREGGGPGAEVRATRRVPREGSKLALLIETLNRPNGATIPDIMEATGWQAHSVRGAMSGAIKKQFGIAIMSEVEGNRGRVYRCTPRPSGAAGCATVSASGELPPLQSGAFVTASTGAE